MAVREKVVAIAEIAALFDVDQRSIKNWIVEGLPHRKRGRLNFFLPSEVVQWRRTQDERARKNAGSAKEHEDRKKAADADLAELKVQQLRGDLVPSAQVRSDIELICGTIRTKILGVRSAWAPRFVGLDGAADAASLLDEMAQSILASLAEAADDLDVEEAEDDDATDDALTEVAA